MKRTTIKREIRKLNREIVELEGEVSDLEEMIAIKKNALEALDALRDRIKPRERYKGYGEPSYLRTFRKSRTGSMSILEAAARMLDRNESKAIEEILAGICGLIGYEVPRSTVIDLLTKEQKKSGARIEGNVHDGYRLTEQGTLALMVRDRPSKNSGDE
jgi:hypothetical protein